MTNEQWNKFKEAAPHFESAKHNWVRNAPRWLSEQTIRIYEDVTGRTMLYHDLSCAICVLHIYQTAAKLYFDELERRKVSNLSTSLIYDEELKNKQKIENEKTIDTKPNSRDKEKAHRDNGSNKKGNAKVKDTKRASKKV